MIAVITTTAGDRITIEASGNLRAPVRMTVQERGGGDMPPASEVLLDEGANDVLRAALIAVSGEGLS